MFRSAARSLIDPESQSAPAGLSFCYDVHGFVLSTCRWKLDEDILLTLDYQNTGILRGASMAELRVLNKEKKSTTVQDAAALTIQLAAGL